jgi:hypothetical protein
MNRDFDVLTEKHDCLEKLISFDDVPVLMGATSQALEKDILSKQEWYISKDTGVIQLNPAIEADILYADYHNPGTVGGLWKTHHEQFAEFIGSEANNVLEIGAGSGILAKYYTENVNRNTKWTIIDPNCSIQENNIKTIKNFFPLENMVAGEYDVLVHSHVLEHTYFPRNFLNDLANISKVGTKHYFSFPNMIEMLKAKYTNTLCFEHVTLLREEYVDVLLSNSGFKINSKFYFRDHSIFYETVFTGEKRNNKFPNLYEENKTIFMYMHSYYDRLIADCNSKIKDINNVWLFGASIFSQYLLFRGLDKSKIVGILDNDTTKTNKRLYGTEFKIVLPKFIADSENVTVLVFVGAYQKEIENQLREINPKVTIIS